MLRSPCWTQPSKWLRSFLLVVFNLWQVELSAFAQPAFQALPPSQAMPASNSSNSLQETPEALGHMDWNPGLLTFSGELLFELPQNEKALDLVLYPNRYLAQKSIESREVLEAYATILNSEDRDLVKRHGAVVVKSANQVNFPGKSCSEIFENKGIRATGSAKVGNSKGRDLKVGLLAQGSLSPAALQFNSHETLLRVVPQQTSLPKGCRTIHLEFTFSPPFSKGNFGMHDTQLMHFSGPVFPISRTSAYHMRMIFSGREVLCSDCRRENQERILEFTGFPSPVHFFEKAPPIVTRIYGGIQIDFVGFESSQDTLDSVDLLTRRALEETPLFALMAARPQRRKITIYNNLLIKNLAQRHRAEIELGTGFLRVPGLFSKYHEAAFARALFAELSFVALTDEHQLNTMSQFRFLYSLSRWMAEERVHNAFNNLTGLRDFSTKFKFIPLFDAILEGKALVNNGVFLGREEDPNDLDTQAFDTIFPTFSGKESQARAAWCLPPEQAASLATTFESSYQNRVPLTSAAAFLGAVQSEKCGESYHRSLFRKSAPEQIEIVSNMKTAKSTAVVFKRQTDTNRLETFFQPSEELPLFDALTIKIRNDEGKVVFEEPWKSGNHSRTVDLALPERQFKAEVSGPTTDVSSNRHILPRKIDFLLNGIKVRYDSRVGTIEGQEGVQWLLRGDEYSRSYSLLGRKEQGKYYLENSFGGTLKSGENTVTELDADNPFLNYIPNQFPFGLGIVSQLGSTGEVLGVVSMGASSASGSHMVPTGASVSFSWSQSLYRANQKDKKVILELSTRVNIPIATLTTGVINFRVGQSNEPQELGGGSGVPGVDRRDLVSKSYGIFRFEARRVLTYDLKWGLANSILFEDVILYAAHNTGVDFAGFKRQALRLSSIQSLQTGLQLYGSFFGAKNQSISADFARSLETFPKNTFSVTLGKSF